MQVPTIHSEFTPRGKRWCVRCGFRRQRFACALALVGVWLLLTMEARASVILADTFSYPTGALVGASGSPWVNHSGATGQVNVLSGQVQLTGTESEDVNAPLTGAPYLTNGPAAALYAKFTVNFTVLPTNSGNYFAHFRDSATGFRCRVWSFPTGLGQYSLGVGNASASAHDDFPSYLNLDTTYTVVMRYTLSDG